MTPNQFNKPRDLETKKPGLRQAESGVEIQKRPDLEVLPAREQESNQGEAVSPVEAFGVGATVKSPGDLSDQSNQSVVKSQRLMEIERILQQDLEDVYFRLEPKTQESFRLKGEQTAQQIEALLGKTKVKAKTIFGLIFDWLKIIPGVNKFFIRQEAKIKTNQLIDLKK